MHSNHSISNIFSLVLAALPFAALFVAAAG
jgi:hypothetical protein